MAVLELHRGGLDPENVARVEEEAARILRELADSLPKADPLHEAVDLLAEELWLEVSGRDFKALAGCQEESPCRPARLAH